MNARVKILIIDKDKNTLEVEITSFMLGQLNYDNTMVKKHNTKTELNNTISEYLKQFN